MQEIIKLLGNQLDSPALRYVLSMVNDDGMLSYGRKVEYLMDL